MNEFTNISSSSSSQRNKTTRHPHRVAQRRRKRRNRRILQCGIILILIAMIVSLFLVFSKLSDNKLIGVWQYNEYTKYEFEKDGTGCLCADDVHYEYTYKVFGNKITIDFAKEIITDCQYDYSINDTELTLNGGVGTDGGTYRLKRIE